MGNGEDDAIRVVVEAYLEDLMPRYLERRRDDVIAIREALASGDMDTVRKVGHQIKGSGGGYGLDRLSELGEIVERAAKEGDGTRAREATDGIVDFLDRVVIDYR